MVENQHELIQGYRDLSNKEVQTVNEIKDLEREISDLWKNIRDNSVIEADNRWLAIARTHFEEGMSALVRSVTKPESPFNDDEDFED